MYCDPCKLLDGGLASSSQLIRRFIILIKATSSTVEPTHFHYVRTVRENSVWDQPIPVKKRDSDMLFSKNNFRLRLIVYLKCIFVNKIFLICIENEKWHLRHLIYPKI